jgi:UDP-glucose 4-epimerase
MKMLITGSSGFIGRTLVKNIEGIPCDISSSDTKPNCDVTNVDDIINSSKDCDGIIHLAALSRVADCESEPQICIDINIKGTLNVIQAAVKNKINWVGIVTTGEVKWIENREIQSFKRINNVYGISKLAGELLLDVYTEKTNLQSTIFRISSVVFGYGDNPNKVFPLFINKAKSGKKITIDNSLYEWDFIHIDDVVETIIKYSATAKNKIYMKEVNILSGMQLDLLSLSKVIHYLTDSSSTIHYGNESINKVTLLEFEDIVNKRKLTKKFISQVKSTIDSSPA